MIIITTIVLEIQIDGLNCLQLIAKRHYNINTMIIRFKHGFKFNDILYGWHKKELYRLPQMIGKRDYPLRKVGKYKELFYVGSKMKSLAQLKSMTVNINRSVAIIEDEDVPF